MKTRGELNGAQGLSFMKKALHVALAFVLVASMVPVCTAHTTQVATAAPTTTQNSTDSWYYYSNIYPSTYTAKNTQEALDVDALANDNKDQIVYTKDGADFFSQIVDKIKADAQKDSANIFDISKDVTVEKASNFFTSSGAGTLKSADESVVEIDDRTPKVLSASSSGVGLTYTVSPTEANNWSMNFTVTGKDSTGTEVSVPVTASFEQTGSVVNISSESDMFDSLTLSTSAFSDPIFDFGTIYTTPAITDVQSHDAALLNKTFTAEAAYPEDQARVTLPDGLIYEDYALSGGSTDTFEVTDNTGFTKRCLGKLEDQAISFNVGNGAGVSTAITNENCKLTITQEKRESDQEQFKAAFGEIDVSILGYEFTYDMPAQESLNYTYSMNDFSNDYYTAKVVGNQLKVKKIKEGDAPDSQKLQLNFYTKGDANNVLFDSTTPLQPTEKTNGSTKSTDEAAIQAAIAGLTAKDLSYIGDTFDLSFTQTFGDKYTVEMDSSCSEEFSLTPSTTASGESKITFKREKMKKAEGTRTNDITFHVYYVSGGLKTELKNNGEDFKITANENTRAADAKKITDAIKALDLSNKGDTATIELSEALTRDYNNLTIVDSDSPEAHFTASLNADKNVITFTRIKKGDPENITLNMSEASNPANLLSDSGFTITVSEDTRTNDINAVNNSLKDPSTSSPKEIDLSYKGDAQEITFEGLTRNDYTITGYDSAIFEVTEVGDHSQPTGKNASGKDIYTYKYNVKRTEDVSSSATCLNGFKFNFYANNTAENILSPTNFTYVVNQDTRDADAKVVTDALAKEIEITYGEAATTITDAPLGLEHSNYAMADTTLKDNEGIDIAKVTFDITTKELKIEPLNAGSVTGTLTLYVTDPYSGNLNDGGFAINVKVNQAKLTLGSIQDMPFRYKADQLSELKKDEYVKGLLSYIDKDNKDHDGCEFVSLDSMALSDYPEGVKDFTGDTTPTLSFNLKEDNNIARNYTIGETQGVSSASVKFTLKAIESNNVEDLNIVGTQGDADGTQVRPTGDTWAAKDVKFTYDGHKLYETDLPASSGEFTDIVEPDNQLNGVNVTKVFAVDNDTKIVTKFESVTFNIDNLAPRVSAMSVDTSEATGEVSSESAIDQIKAFFFGVNKKAHIGMTLTDAIENADATRVSGFDKGTEVKVDYRDSGADTSVTRTLENGDSSSSHVSDSINFDIEGTSDVVTDSFRVTLTDRAKNTASGVEPQGEIPSEVMRLVTESNAPTINVSFDNNDVRNGSFYNADRTVTITLTDDHFDYIKQYQAGQEVVVITVDGNRSVLYPGDFEQVGNEWVKSVTFSMDADYTLSAGIRNLASEYVSGGEYAWTIDKTAPSANVVWDNENATNGNYYSASRTATVTITEHNFDAGTWSVTPTGSGGNGSEYGAPSVDGWTNYGDTHICHVTFPGQGNYSMTITGEDSALNPLSTYEVSEFIVDTIQPTIQISVNGQADAASHAYPDNANVSIAVNDTNVDASSAISIESISWNGSGTPYTENRTSTNTALTVEMPNPANVPESDGVYRVTVNARDMAGNTQTKTVDWSVNRFGSTYVVSDSTKDIISKKYVKSSDMKDVMITEINPSGINEDSATAKVAKGTSTQNVQKGKGFTFAAAAEANGWPAFSYTIDKGQYASDAMYQTIVSSTDSAGRASDNTMADKNSTRQSSADVSFAVDNTAPIVSYSGFDEDVVAGTNHKVNAYVEDNMKLDRAVIEVNGEEVQELNASDLNSKNHEIVLNESRDTQTVTVKAYDAAGNMASVDSASIFINSDPLARLMHNTVLFVCLIILLAVIIGGLLWYFLFFKRRKRDEDQA